MRIALTKLPASLTRILGGLLLLLALPALHAQGAGKRVALVIGNDAYSMSPLKNAVNDARVMDKALKTSGFQTILLENGKKADMDRVVGEFLDKLGPDDTALFYFAGHGVQIENENFLVPVDFAPVTTISAAKFACMSVAQIFDELKRKRAKQNIVILDACRSNPAATKYSLEAGLAKPQDAPKETFIAFSTGPGQTATDNPDGRNSWFTEALADYISQDSLKVEVNDIFTRVKRRVSDATEGRQTPWTTSNQTTRFFFHPPADGDAGIDSSLLQKWLEDSAVREQHEEWADALDLASRVTQKKPGGAMEELARSRVAYLTARRDAEARFAAGDLTSASKLFEDAVKLDPFASDAALQGVNSYLLQDRIPDAVKLLHVIRQRGTSEAVTTADQMLKQLAAASPEAAKETLSPPPQPPSVEELFAGTKFGAADGIAGKQHLQNTSVDIARWTKDVKMDVAIPATLVPVLPAVTTASVIDATGAPASTATPDPVAATQAAAITAAVFHFEVVPTAETRNLRLRASTPEEFGYLQFEGGAADTPVLFEGQQVMLPNKLKLPAGKYDVRTVDAGKVLNSELMSVTPASTQTFKVKRP